MRWLLLQLSDLSMVSRCQILTQMQCQPKSCLYFPAWFSLRKHENVCPSIDILCETSSRWKYVCLSVSPTKYRQGKKTIIQISTSYCHIDGISGATLGFALCVYSKMWHRETGIKKGRIFHIRLEGAHNGNNGIRRRSTSSLPYFAIWSQICIQCVMNTSLLVLNGWVKLTLWTITTSFNLL